MAFIKSVRPDIPDVGKLRAKISETLDLDGLYIPSDIKISTMTLEARIGTRFNPINIYKYIKKSKNGIIRIVKAKKKKKKKIKVVKKNNIHNNKKKLNKNKNKNKQSDEFLNQVTLSINVSSKKEKPVSVKAFNSGTMHFTGVVCIDDLLEAAYKFFVECRKTRAIIKNNKIHEISFAEDISKLKINDMYDFKIDMVNCGFLVPFNINRPKLQILLKSDNYNAVYDSNRHAGVKIKFVGEDDGNKITVFVFESGKIIIILGNQGYRKIKQIYTFVYKYLLENYDIIIKDDNLINSSIIEYIDKITPSVEPYDQNIIVKNISKEEQPSYFQQKVFQCKSVT